MERFDKLFREAERIRPPSGMWERIAARAGLDRARSGSGRARGGLRRGGNGEGWGRRMAASLAVGLGLLTAMLVVLRVAPKVAEEEGGAGDFSVASAQVSPLPDDEILDWHAGLGEEADGDWEDMSLLEAAAAEAED